MASRMGIIYPNYDPLRGLSKAEKDVVNSSNIIPKKPMLTDKQWDLLQKYIINNAPDSVVLDQGKLFFIALHRWYRF